MTVTSLTVAMVMMLSVLDPGECSVKKGLAVSNYRYTCHDLDAFTNIHWWYDWNQTPYYHHKSNCSGEPPHSDIRVPMVWGWRHGVENPPYFHPGSHYVLVFNEPNHRHQADLTPKQAADAWKIIQKRADHQGQKLVGPCAIKCHSSNCMMDAVPWLDEFFSHCHGCRVDYLATHGYWCRADDLLDFVEVLYKRYHKRIWVTEFACPSSNPDRALAFMKEALPRLDASPHVFRYAWYASRVRGTGSAKQQESLLHQDSGQLTDLGRYYNNHV